jgi:Protein of unknown function (DUF295)
MQQVANKKVCFNGMIATDWSLLKPDLLYVVSNKLGEITYFIRFRAVCKAWRLAVPLRDSPSFLPWILVRQDATTNEDLQFYSPFSGKTYSISVPQASGKRLMGPTSGYFLGYKYRDLSLSLLNPFTRKEIHLPPLKGEIRYPLPLSIAMNIEESEDKVSIWGLDGTNLETLLLGISQPGDAHWTLTKPSTPNMYGACAYYKDMYFIIKPLEECTTVYDVITGNIVCTIPDFKKRNGVEILEHLVESGGKLLRVMIRNYKNIKQLSVEIYVLNVEKGYRWFEIYDIDDHILFLDRYGAFSFKCDRNYGLRGNCIYFFSHMVRVNNEVERCILRRYDLLNGNIDTLPFPFMRCSTWIIPKLC